MGDHVAPASFGRDAAERVIWSTVEGAATGALAGWGAAVITNASDFHAFLIGVAVPAGMALFTSIKVLAARKLGRVSDAALPLGRPYTSPH